VNYLITDTHPLVWFMLAKLKRLPSKVKQAFDGALEGRTAIWVPSVVLWEISLIQKAGKIQLKYPLQQYVSQDFGARAMHLLDLETEDILRADALTFSTDAFDTMIVAMAQRMECPLITADTVIHDSRQCEVYWD
jgi:PIN domain nuclease of toxin-antitoxin system